MNKNQKTYKWGNIEIELGKVYTMKDLPAFGKFPHSEQTDNKEDTP